MATIVKDLGAVTAYAYAKEKGYTGTEDEFAELMASYADVAEQAAESAAQAGASAEAAEQAKAEAVLSASAAASSASTASTKASEAAQSASSASGSANTATTKANEASTSATNAASSASAAATSATNAGASATAAASSATAASNAKTAAETAQGKAEDAQTAAEDAAEQAGIYAAGYLKAFPVDTASGSIASFPDGADELPVKDLTVAVEPVQDLHGYDSPWPEGGGKNKFPVADWYAPYDASKNYLLVGNTSVFIPAGTYTLSFEYYKGDAPMWSSFWRLYSEKVTAVDSTKQLEFRSVGLTDASTWAAKTITFTTTQDGWFGLDDTQLRGGFHYRNIQLESGSSKTAFAPYSNICPISGWTGAKVTRTGVNVWDEETEIGRLNTNTGADESSPAQLRTKNYVPVIGGKTYYFGTPTLTGSGQGMWILFYDDSKSVISGYTPPESVDKYQNAFRPQNGAMTVPANAKYLRFYLTPEYGTTYSGNIFINYPSTYTSYSPYAGNTYSITFSSEAGTVYGGTLDVTTGKLTVDRAMEVCTWGDFSYKTTLGNYARGNYDLSNTAVYPATAKTPQISNIAPCLADFASDTLHFYCNGSQAIFFLPVGTPDSTTIQVSYELATPIVYDLTPTEVDSLLGANNIWADCGDSTVDYYADPTLYINRKIAAAVAAMS